MDRPGSVSAPLAALSAAEQALEVTAGPVASCALPALQGYPPALPESDRPWAATWADLRSVFVDQGPQSQWSARDLRLRALELHAEVVGTLFRGVEVRMWVNGGFLTHKDWRPPADIDVVYLVPPEQIVKATKRRALPLWTLSKASGIIGGEGGADFNDATIKPGFGFVDAYIAADTPLMRKYWFRQWSTVKGPDGNIIEGRRKGFVEVTING